MKFSLLFFIVVCAIVAFTTADVPAKCLLRKKVDESGRGLFRRWFYNRDNGKCEEFTYGGGEKNENHFRSEEECKTECFAPEICSLPLVVDESGRGYFPRWFYNKDTGKCEGFTYGGGNKNENHFRSEERCKIVCLNTEAS